MSHTSKYVQESLSNNQLIPDYSGLRIRAILWFTARHNRDDISNTGHSDHANCIWNYFLPRRKISLRLEASEASGVCTSNKTERPSSSLNGFRRAICPRCLLDRMAQSQCSHLCQELFKVTSQHCIIIRTSRKYITIF
jgi:hypothetical protein